MDYCSCKTRALSVSVAASAECCHHRSLSLMLCSQHSRLLLQSLRELVRASGCSSGGQAWTGQVWWQSYSTGDSRDSELDGSKTPPEAEPVGLNDPSVDMSAFKADDMLAQFNKRVAALQGSQSTQDLDALRQAAGQQSAKTSKPKVNLLQQQRTLRQQDDDSDFPSSSNSNEQPAALWSRQYGYAVLGGVNPAASQQEAGAQQPKLHPTRNFRQGDMYDPTDLSPLSREERDPMMPRVRQGRRKHQMHQYEVKRQLDYKNVDFLLNFVSESGRIKSRRATGLPPVLQAKVARTVKMARQMALLPYEMRVGEGSEGDRWKLMRRFKAEQAQQASQGWTQQSTAESA